MSAAALALAATAACAPTTSQSPGPKPITAYATAKSFQAPAAEWPKENWWTVYGDAQLTKLIEEALEGSPTLAQAEARVRRAEYAADQADVAGGPSFDPSVKVQAVRQSLNQGFPDEFKSLFPRGWHGQGRLALDFSWQLDFWGKNRARIAAATSEAQAAAADAAVARLQISTGMAATYAELMRLFADREAAEAALKVRKETVGLVTERNHAGLENRGAVAQAEASIPVLEGEIASIDRQIASARNQIAALIGAGPDRGLAVARPANAAIRPLGLPATLGMDLVGRRADIAAARLRAEAAGHKIKQARANFYPNVDLTGSYGLQSFGLSTLLEKDSLTGAFGPAVSLPIFHRRTNTAVYGQAVAEYDAAVASYDEALGQALREVADAVSGQRAIGLQIASARKALGSNEEAYRIAQLRYRGGLSPYLDVLTAENTLLQQRRTVADLEAQALSLDVALVRALGGGFKDETGIQGRANG
ncbi:MAG: efflux transporter outer membrane subunit [Caulobacteraceae bacterium]